MTYTKSFTIGSVVYNAAQAAAIEQDELMSHISATVMERIFRLAREGHETSETALVPMFMSMPQSVKQRVATILTSKVLINGTNTRVSVADFGGRVVEWNTLLAQLLEWNLSDFFIWLEDAVKDVRPQNQPEKV